MGTRFVSPFGLIEEELISLLKDEIIARMPGEQGTVVSSFIK